ncbi:MAG: hypothetical protein IPH49_03565 [Ignavibacteria bacterium]|nr:hypothetical protein [Ignavibacteria bacterium]
MKQSMFLRVFISTVLVLLGLVTSSQISRSQIFVEVDGGVGGVRAWGYTTYVYNPLCDWSNTQRNQYIFRASELSSRE